MKDQLTRDAFLDGKMNAEHRDELMGQLSEPVTKASNTLTIATDVVVINDDTFTIGTTVVTIEAAAATANSIVSATDIALADMATSIAEFINGEEPSVTGVTFNENTFDEDVVATSAAGVVTITAKVAGVAGNAIATTETFTAVGNVFAAATLTGAEGRVLKADMLLTPDTYADDAAAAAAGVPVGGIYRVTTTGVVQWRVA